MRNVFWERLDIIATVLMIGLPLLSLVGLGSLFLYSEGLLVQFAVLSLTCVTILHGIRYSIRSRGDRGITADEKADHFPEKINPSWGGVEREVYNECCSLIGERTTNPVSWDSNFVKLAEEVVEHAAWKLSNCRHDKLDVTILEVLGLLDRTVGECRDMFTKSKLTYPLDHFSINSLLWMSRHRNLAANLLESGDFIFTMGKIIVNPPAGVSNLAKWLITKDNASYLTEQAQVEIQRNVLVYIAAKSIDLYSGRFKSRTVSGPSGRTLEPIKILLVGQTGVGKTSLSQLLDAPSKTINLAKGEDSGPTSGLVKLEGLQCLLSEFPGIDSTGGRNNWLSSAMQKVLAGRSTHENMQAFNKAALDCDMIIWLLKANEPARGVDFDYLKQFEKIYEEKHRWRRKPPLLAVVTNVDKLIQSWPHNGSLSPAQLQKIRDAAAPIRENFGHRQVIEVKLTPPTWQVEELGSSVGGLLQEATHAQTNRLQSRGKEVRRPKGADTSATRKNKANRPVSSGLLARLRRRKAKSTEDDG